MCQFLVKRVSDLASIMLTRLTRKSFQFNRSICHQYDEIVNRITSPAKTTEELVDLENYIDNLRTGPLLQLKASALRLLGFWITFEMILSIPMKAVQRVGRVLVAAMTMMTSMMMMTMANMVVMIVMIKMTRKMM